MWVRTVAEEDPEGISFKRWMWTCWWKDRQVPEPSTPLSSRLCSGRWCSPYRIGVGIKWNNLCKVTQRSIASNTQLKIWTKAIGLQVHVFGMISNHLWRRPSLSASPSHWPSILAQIPDSGVGKLWPIWPAIYIWNSSFIKTQPHSFIDRISNVKWQNETSPQKGKWWAAGLCPTEGVELVSRDSTRETSDQTANGSIVP